MCDICDFDTLKDRRVEVMLSFSAICLVSCGLAIASEYDSLCNISLWLKLVSFQGFLCSISMKFGGLWIKSSMQILLVCFLNVCLFVCQQNRLLY